MLKLSIVPDTNVMLTDLELIKQLYHNKMPVAFTINFARTVLDELDSMKTTNIKARNAIRFIENISGSMKIEMEGKIDDRKVEVIIEAREMVQPKNNDDKILNYCFQLENPIFLTNDKAFHLKCQTFNIKSILVNGMQIDGLIASIMKEIGLTYEGCNSENKDDEYLNRLKNVLKKTIEPTIESILHREVGDGSSFIVEQNPTLENYLELVRKNFFLFKDFLPSKAPKIIGEFIEALKKKDVNKIDKMIHSICMLFRKSFPVDEL